MSVFLRSLPLLYRCIAPGLAFTQLTGKESMTILYNLTSVCTDVDPQVNPKNTCTVIVEVTHFLF